MQSDHSSLVEQILDYISTTSDLASVQEIIHDFLNKLYSVNQKNIPSLIEDQFPDEIGSVIKELIHKSKIDPTNTEEVKLFFQDVSKVLSKCRPISLTLAFHPTSRMVQKFSDFVKRELGKNVILEINYAPQIIAGAVITYNGRYLDLSIKKKVENLIESKKNDILKMITKSN